ncbi:hypothetical protein C482_14244 [Natrialba chahannaoensis JCM 10990]|uniref:Uncharacterized protein n=1 Tax=Natrialba chahannaoensis JCM 10990 TaxID=1227492 RepID=M0AHU0_9EURY|nr:hypothetical protein C482_14244 [Natrialba chahannaoensis JCM 10990]
MKVQIQCPSRTRIRIQEVTCMVEAISASGWVQTLQLPLLSGVKASKVEASGNTTSLLKGVLLAVLLVIVANRSNMIKMRRCDGRKPL